MSYQLPPLLNEDIFEKLVRDILRRDCKDPGIERFGRKGQAQHGIDGFSPAKSGVTFQCKLKDTRYAGDEPLRKTLSSEMETELENTKGLEEEITRFIFASTFKNDAHLQQRARQLSSPDLVVEYWGWDTINEKIWKHAEEILPYYYPHCPVKSVPGFRRITPEEVDANLITDQTRLKQLAFDYYRINDRDDVVFGVVCNDVDVRNDVVMQDAFSRLEKLEGSGTLWIVGNGGSGKTTILYRLAKELALKGQSVYMLNLEYQLEQDDLEHILNIIKYTSENDNCALCIDNPASDEETLTKILRRIPELNKKICVLLSERGHRYQAMKRSGSMTFIHGEEERDPVVVKNSKRQRELVYDRLFELLGLTESERKELRERVLNQNLVYVNTTYTILLELKKNRRIDFDFDWDDFQKMTQDLPAFRDGYRYIALFYLMGVKAPFEVLARINGADAAQKSAFLSRFRGLQHEPVVVTEWRDEMYQKQVLLRTKHEIVSEIYFHEHPEINKNELMMEWCENTCFGNIVEAQALVNVFGAKKNYFADNAHIDYEFIINFMLCGPVVKSVSQARKLYETLHLARFWILLARGEESKAVETLLSALKLMPYDLHFRTELAKIYQRQGKLNEAEAILNELLKLESKDLQARTELAKIYQRQDKLEEAEKILKEILTISPKDLNSRTELAKTYQRQGNLDEAEKILNEILAISPKDLNSRTELAKIYQRQGKLSEAEAILKDLLNIDKKNLQARTELAKIYQRQGKLDEAEMILKGVMTISPKDLNSRTELAKIYQRQNKLAEAEAILKESLEIDSKQLHPRTELAKIYQRQNKLAEAEAILKDLLTIDKKNLQARTELAKIYQRQGKLDKAKAILKDLLTIDKKNLQARTELSKIYQRQNKLAEAEAILKESLEIDAKQLHPRTELAKIYQRQGKLSEAEAILKEALEIDAKQLHPRTELAKIYQRQGKLDKAEAILKESLEIDSKQLHPRTELAKIYQRQNKLAEAEAILKESLEIDSKQLHPRTELAKIYQRQNKLAEAEAILKDLLTIDKKNLQARTELAKIYQRQNKLAEAEAILKESLEIDAKQLHPRTELSKIYQRQGKLSEAEAILKESLEIDAKQLHPRTELSKIYQRQGKLSEAEAIAEETLTIDPANNHAMSELLAIWRKQGKSRLCAERFLNFIKQTNYRFGNQSQAPVFRFFQCCKDFGMKGEADSVFARFGEKLDNINKDFYKNNFT